MNYYLLKDFEMKTLAYHEFETTTPQAHPVTGRSYVIAEVENLVYRKYATLWHTESPGAYIFP
jgi:hypothetical protein